MPDVQKEFPKESQLVQCISVVEKSNEMLPKTLGPTLQVSE